MVVERNAVAFASQKEVSRYAAVKSSYPGKILVCQFGRQFYTSGPDAKTLARILGREVEQRPIRSEMPEYKVPVLVFSMDEFPAVIARLQLKNAPVVVCQHEDGKASGKYKTWVLPGV